MNASELIKAVMSEKGYSAATLAKNSVILLRLLYLKNCGEKMVCAQIGL